MHVGYKTVALASGSTALREREKEIIEKKGKKDIMKERVTVGEREGSER